MATTKHKDLKAKIIQETRKFLGYSAILMVFFSAFTLYRLLILREYGIDVAFFGYNLFQSLILAKIIVLGEALGIGERYQNKPLIIPTIYKTIIFLLFVIAFAILEHFVIDFFKGKNFEESIHTFFSFRLYQILAGTVVMSFFFFLFFAFMELGKTIGDDKLYNLFFKSKKV